jgi:hypothetical protein
MQIGEIFLRLKAMMASACAQWTFNPMWKQSMDQLFFQISFDPCKRLKSKVIWPALCPELHAFIKKAP